MEGGVLARFGGPCQQALISKKVFPGSPVEEGFGYIFEAPGMYRIAAPNNHISGQHRGYSLYRAGVQGPLSLALEKFKNGGCGIVLINALTMQ